MEQMTITAKIQIVVDETDKVLLDETMSVYRKPVIMFQTMYSVLMT